MAAVKRAGSQEPEARIFIMVPLCCFEHNSFDGVIHCYYCRKQTAKTEGKYLVILASGS